MLLRGDDAFGNLRPLHHLVGVEVAQLHACQEQTAQTGVNLLLADPSVLHGFGQMAIEAAALHVGAGADANGHRLFGCLHHIMIAGQEVVDGTAVAGDEPLETPLLAQYLLLVARLGAAGFTIHTLIGAHHLLDVSFLYQCLEGGHIGLPQVALGQVFHVEGMAVPLWSAMHGEVLGTCQQFAVLGIVGALQATHHGHAHPRRQVGVFAIGLLSAPPPWVTEDVDVGCPEREALILPDAP